MVLRTVRPSAVGVHEGGLGLFVVLKVTVGHRKVEEDPPIATVRECRLQCLDGFLRTAEIRQSLPEVVERTVGRPDLDGPPVRPFGLFPAAFHPQPHPEIRVRTSPPRRLGRAIRPERKRCPPCLVPRVSHDRRDHHQGYDYNEASWAYSCPAASGRASKWPGGPRRRTER